MKAGIIGASGYTGRELVKILSRHPEIELISVYGRQSGVALSSHIPELSGLCDTVILPIDVDTIIKNNDVLFLAVPHGVSMELSPSFQDKIPLIDLSADYRLTDEKDYTTWYGTPHKDADQLGQYTYGLPEYFRDQIRQSKKIASPGCYPTSVLLGVLPLMEKGLIRPKIIVDAKSGHSGAGKALKESLLAGRVSENIQAYKLLNHQHIGEMESVFTRATGQQNHQVFFTPQMMPFDRGILSSIYFEWSVSPLSPDALSDLYRTRYADEKFVRLYDGQNGLPAPKWVNGSNYCDIYVTSDPRTGQGLILSCIDNLIKGAGGQSVQAMNIMFGFDETQGLI